MNRMNQRWSSRSGSTTAGFLFGFAIAALVAGVGLWLVRGSGVRIDTSRPAVVHHIQQLRRLESDVRREAERQITKAALDGGILQAAATNARTTVTTFLQSLGFERVEVR